MAGDGLEEISSDARILTVHTVPVLKPRRSSNLVRLCMEQNASELAVSRALERTKTSYFEADVKSLVTSTLGRTVGKSSRSLSQLLPDNFNTSPKPRASKIAEMPLSSMSYLPDRKETISECESPNEVFACNWLDVEFPTPDQISMMQPKSSKRHNCNRPRVSFRALGLSQSGRETKGTSPINQQTATVKLQTKHVESSPNHEQRRKQREQKQQVHR